MLQCCFESAAANATPRLSADAQFSPGYEYDARLFLSHTQQTQFNRQYPEFDESRAERNWKWKDIDPLGLLTPAENRSRRRELFLMEYSSTALPDADRSPSAEQVAFQPILETQFEDPVILMSVTTLKISTAYTESYERNLPVRNLLEKVAQVGLQWAQLGGISVYLYNGPILLARYRNGRISLADTNVDRPPVVVKRRPRK